MWTPYGDQQHRLENWSNFLKLESKRGDDSSKDAQIAALERRLKQLENRANQQRSMSPRPVGRGCGRQNQALPAPGAVLALPAPPTPVEKGAARAVGAKVKVNSKIRPRGKLFKPFRNFSVLKERHFQLWHRLEQEFVTTLTKNVL